MWRELVLQLKRKLSQLSSDYNALCTEFGSDYENLQLLERMWKRCRFPDSTDRHEQCKTLLCLAAKFDDSIARGVIPSRRYALALNSIFEGLYGVTLDATKRFRELRIKFEGPDFYKYRRKHIRYRVIGNQRLSVKRTTILRQRTPKRSLHTIQPELRLQTINAYKTDLLPQSITRGKNYGETGVYERKKGERLQTDGWRRVLRSGEGLKPKRPVRASGRQRNEWNKWI